MVRFTRNFRNAHHPVTISFLDPVVHSPHLSRIETVPNVNEEEPRHHAGNLSSK